MYINGKKVDSSVLSPAVSQLDKRSLVVTYDITSFLKSGKNEILLWLGKGWYKKTTFKAEHDGPVVRADLSTLKDGKWKNFSRQMLRGWDVRVVMLIWEPGMLCASAVNG